MRFRRENLPFPALSILSLSSSFLYEDGEYNVSNPIPEYLLQHLHLHDPQLALDVCDGFVQIPGGALAVVGGLEGPGVGGSAPVRE